jgi:4a-hydroxytetrahydrobiopterin dehydratase
MERPHLDIGKMSRRWLLASTVVVRWGISVEYGWPMPTDLTPDQIDAFLSTHPVWILDGESISRTYVFADFNEAMGFVVRVGIASDVVDHHPDIDIRWNKVTCVLSTHDQGVLTRKDLELASTFDGFVD